MIEHKDPIVVIHQFACQMEHPNLVVFPMVVRAYVHRTK